MYAGSQQATEPKQPGSKYHFTSHSSLQMTSDGFQKQRHAKVMSPRFLCSVHPNPAITPCIPHTPTDRKIIPFAPPLVLFASLLNFKSANLC